MCCGRGGDIIKWLKLNVRHLVCTDIAETSVQYCKERFMDISAKFNKTNSVKFEIFPADCTRVSD